MARLCFQGIATNGNPSGESHPLSRWRWSISLFYDLIIQTKRKDHLGNKRERRRYAYAAQVFAEMLGQISPTEWINTGPLQEQEVPHSSILS